MLFLLYSPLPPPPSILPPKFVAVTAIDAALQLCDHQYCSVLDGCSASGLEYGDERRVQSSVSVDGHDDVAFSREL
jgi:hypothetical protein